MVNGKLVAIRLQIIIPLISQTKAMFYLYQGANNHILSYKNFE